MYEIDRLEAVVNELDRQIPKTDFWPLSFAQSVLDVALRAASLTADVAAPLLDSAPQEIRSAVLAAVRPRNDAVSAIIPFARALSTASGDSIYLPGFRSSVFHLMRVSIDSWRVLEDIEKSRPWFLRISRDQAAAVRALDASAAELERLSDEAARLSVPSFPAAPTATPSDPVLVPPKTTPLVIQSSAGSIAFLGVVVGGLAAAGYLLRHKFVR